MVLVSIIVLLSGDLLCLGSGVIAGATEVVVVRVRGSGALGHQRLFVKAGAQHGLDRAVGVGAHGQGAGASRFQAVRAITLAQAHYAQAGPKALFG